MGEKIITKGYGREFRKITVMQNGKLIETKGIVSDELICHLPSCNRKLSSGHGFVRKGYCCHDHHIQHRNMNITVDEKQQIRELFKQGKSYRELADKFGVSKSRIYQIIKRYKMNS